MRRLVFLVDGKAAFIAQCFQELDAQFVDVGVIHVFQHNVVMYLVVVEIKESVVQVFLVCPWIDIVHDGRLARARKSIEPDVWMMLDSRWFLLLDQCLYFFRRIGGSFVDTFRMLRRLCLVRAGRGFF